MMPPYALSLPLDWEIALSIDLLRAELGAEADFDDLAFDLERARGRGVAQMMESMSGLVLLSRCCFCVGSLGARPRNEDSLVSERA